MLCSEQELKLSESHDGIIELPASAVLGTSIQDYYAMNDTVI
jgi:phenylalanyl-tRNA synthetase beta chain